MNTGTSATGGTDHDAEGDGDDDSDQESDDQVLERGNDVDTPELPDPVELELLPDQLQGREEGVGGVGTRVPPPGDEDDGQPSADEDGEQPLPDTPHRPLQKIALRWTRTMRREVARPRMPRASITA
jgi:hypothetical protein